MTGLAICRKSAGLYRQMKVAELLRFFSQLKGHAAFRGEINGWLERLQLSQWADHKVEALSKGMSRKVRQFIAAVIERPTVAFTG